MEASSIMTDFRRRSQGRRSEHRVAAPGDRAALRASVVAGARAVVPIAIAVVAFGVSFGILARDAGMGVVAPILMSATTFAGSAQFAVASVLESGGAVAAAIVAAVLLNLRYLAIGVSVAPALRGPAARRVAEAQLSVDESWAVAQHEGRVDRGRLLGAGGVLMVAWTGGTAAGVLGGSALGDPADYGLDAMFPALFLALLVGQLDGPRTRISALAGGLIALALTPVLPAGLPIVVATLGAVIALTVRHRGAVTGAAA
jgi:4-azaleucine resistance transporter AzlC